MAIYARLLELFSGQVDEERNTSMCRSGRMVGHTEAEPLHWHAQKSAICVSSGLLATNLPLFTHHLQLLVALRVDLFLAPRQHILRRDVANRAVQADVVVVVHISVYQTPCIIERKRRSRPDALPFERFVPALDLFRSIAGKTERSGRASFPRSE